MALRDVVITATINEPQGDETYELWLKRGAAPWSLEDVGDVPDTATQDFEILGLEEAVVHVMQLRMKRQGRYRVGYLTADPDSWPSQSRYEFTPGLSDDIGAPSITDTSWARTSGVLHTTTVEVTPHLDHDDLDIQLLRNGVVIATATAPHGGPVLIDDDNPPSEVLHEYTARHVVGFLAGPESAVVEQWPGPPAPSALEDISASNFYEYEVQWVNGEASAHTQLQDDYSDAGVYVDRALANPAATTQASGVLPKSSVMAPNGNLNGKVGTRVRHEWTQFAVTDVSQWHTLPDSDPDCVVIQYSPDETLYDDTRPL